MSLEAKPNMVLSAFDEEEKSSTKKMKKETHHPEFAAFLKAVGFKETETSAQLCPWMEKVLKPQPPSQETHVLPKTSVPKNNSTFKKTKKSSRKKKTFVTTIPIKKAEEFSLREDWKKCIDEKGGTDVVVVIEKHLSETDLKKHQNRLSIPVNQVITGFLTVEEEKQLNKNKRKKAIPVKLIEPDLVGICSLNLAKWSMNSSSMYVLNENWNSVCLKYRLEGEMKVQLWSFRVGSELWFALILV